MCYIILNVKKTNKNEHLNVHFAHFLSIIRKEHMLQRQDISNQTYIFNIFAPIVPGSERREARNTGSKVNWSIEFLQLAACVSAASLLMFHWFICGTDKSISDFLQAAWTSMSRRSKWEHVLFCVHSCTVFMDLCNVKTWRFHPELSANAHD